MSCQLPGLCLPVETPSPASKTLQRRRFPFDVTKAPALLQRVCPFVSCFVNGLRSLHVGSCRRRHELVKGKRGEKEQISSFCFLSEFLTRDTVFNPARAYAASGSAGVESSLASLLPKAAYVGEDERYVFVCQCGGCLACLRLLLSVTTATACLVADVIVIPVLVWLPDVTNPKTASRRMPQIGLTRLPLLLRTLLLLTTSSSVIQMKTFDIPL